MHTECTRQSLWLVAALNAVCSLVVRGRVGVSEEGGRGGGRGMVAVREGGSEEGGRGREGGREVGREGGRQRGREGDGEVHIQPLT